MSRFGIYETPEAGLAAIEEWFKSLTRVTLPRQVRKDPKSEWYYVFEVVDGKPFGSSIATVFKMDINSWTWDIS